MNALDHIELLSDDFARLLSASKANFQELNGASILITGGTGFFGTWLAHSFLAAMRQHRYHFDIHILCRQPGRFLDSYPCFKDHKGFHFHAHDVAHPLSLRENVDYVIHAATPASAKINSESPLVMIDTIVSGMRHVLNFVSEKKIKNLVFTSSGAVYGSIDYGLKIPETSMTGPDLANPKSAYGEGKRLAELLCSIYKSHYGLNIQILRCFAFVGPFMSFDSHFAMGNFILNAIQQKAPFIRGDHRTVRSYLYGADLVHAIIGALTLPGEDGLTSTYNVGSDIPISIADLAETIRSNFKIKEPVGYADDRKLSDAIDWYVPSIEKIRKKIGFVDFHDINASIKKTSKWLIAQRRFQGLL